MSETTISVPSLASADGLDGEDLRVWAREVIARVIAPCAEEAAHVGLFPVEVVRTLGALGWFRSRWSGGRVGQPLRAHAFAEELGRSGVGSIAAGIGVHGEAILAMLTRFAGSDALRWWRDQALDGTKVGCIGFSEPTGGSTLNGVTTLAVPHADGWHVQGTKKFISLGATADFALVLCRVESARAKRVPLAVVLVPREGITVLDVFRKVGTESIETTRLQIDAVVPDEHVLARPGAGLAVAMWGLAHERMSLVTQATGACDLAIGVTTTRLKRRRSGGVSLWDQQALRMRLGLLAAEVAVNRLAITSAWREIGEFDGPSHRDVAALKVRTAQLAERVMSECMQLFGGCGYLPDETPLGQWWRDIRLLRIAAGTDEMMCEFIASGLEGDDEAYDRLVRTDP